MRGLCEMFRRGKAKKSGQVKNTDPFVIFFLSKIANEGKKSFPEGIEEKPGKQVECQMQTE